MTVVAQATTGRSRLLFSRVFKREATVQTLHTHTHLFNRPNLMTTC